MLECRAIQLIESKQIPAWVVEYQTLLGSGGFSGAGYSRIFNLYFKWLALIK
jgi:hypothetical protein